MLITQKNYSGLDMLAWLGSIGSYVAGTSTSLVFQSTGGRFVHITGTGLSYDAFSATWSGQVTAIQQAVGGVPDALNKGLTGEVTYSTPLNVSAMSLSLTGDFFIQLFNVPGNSNTGTGDWFNDTLAGSDNIDNLNGGTGTDMVDYSRAGSAVVVDLSGLLARAGAAVGDVLTSIEGVRGTRFGDTLRGDAAINRLEGGGGDDLIYGTALNDTVFGGAGWDRLDLTALAGNINVYGGTIYPASGGFTTYGEIESFVTGSGNDTIWGQAGSFEYITNAGADLIKLSTSGNKTVSAGAGNDTLEVYGADSISADMGGDTDSMAFVVSTGAAQIITMTSPGTAELSGVFSGTVSGVEIISSGSMRLNYWGHDGRDEVWASIGNDTLQGNHGDDALYGGNGNDILRGDGDWGLQGGADAYGSDTVQGGGGDDLIWGANGADVYSGGAGVDTLSYAQFFDDYGYGEYSITLNGNNTVTKYFADWYGDVYSETDTILTGTGDDIEVIVGTYLGDAFYNTTGSSRSYQGSGGADVFWIWAATSGETVLDLGFGADVLRVRAATPITAFLGGNWTATAQSDTLGPVTFDTQGWNIDLRLLGAATGVTLRNTSPTDGAVMYGTALADRFESASALDEMHGGAGGDTYVVTATLGFPLIYEDYGAAGVYEIITSVDGLYMGDTIENATLLDGAVTVNGNAYANRITGNDAANVIRGGGGADTLAGGEGSDTYYVTGTETLVEAGYQAPYFDIDFGWVIDPDRDLVISTVSFALKNDGLEDLRLDTGALNGTGNLQGNAITGNTAANSLRGLAGDDSLVGGLGNDTLLGGTENDRLRGDGGVDSLRGDAGNDTLLGGDGADVLVGGTGANRLTGGRGADQFVFGRQLETTVVTDFTDGVDKLAFAAATGSSESFLLNNAQQDGTDVLIFTTVAGMEIRVLNTTIAALAGDILIL